jgi:hypothetical protein
MMHMVYCFNFKGSRRWIVFASSVVPIIFAIEKASFCVFLAFYIHPHLRISSH